MEAVTEAGELPLRGNQLAVNFVNTVSDVRAGEREFLDTPSALVAWARHAGAVDDVESRQLTRAVRANPRAARSDHARALDLRRGLTRILTGTQTSDDVELVDWHRRRSATSHRLTAGQELWSIEWNAAPDLKLVTCRVADAFVRLATSERFHDIRQCDGPRCGWLYVDTSRGHRRRWCSMDDCGNRNKVHRFRAR